MNDDTQPPKVATFESYSAGIRDFTDLIFKQIPEHPEIMEMGEGDKVWELLRIPALADASKDLQLTLMQARYALAFARKRWREGQETGASVQSPPRGS